MWKTLAGAGVLLVLVTAYAGYRIGFGMPFTLNELANRQAALFLLDNPEMLTEVGVVDGSILDFHSGKLAAVGVPKRDSDYRMMEKFIGQVRQFDRSKLSRQDQITYDILLDQYNTLLSFRRFGWLSSEGLYPLAPMWGTQVQLTQFLETQHGVTNEKTARNYVKRLQATGVKLDAAVAEMQRQTRAGVIMPAALLDKAEAGIKDATVGPSDADPLVTTFADRMKRVAGISPKLREELLHQAAQTIQTDVYPAYARMLAALEAQRPAAARQTAGVDRLPDGAAYYAATLRQMTTTDYTPEQVHALGLTEVARIGGELDTRLVAQGLTAGSVGERVHALHTDARFLLPDTDAGRQQLIDRYQQILDQINARMPDYFRSIPTTPLRVIRVPLATEKGSAGAYYVQAALDGSRPGTFYVNLRNVPETATWTMKTLAYHEGIPGHHFQISISLGLKNLPLIRQEGLYSPYSEGWALYAERLAAEIGMYSDDPFGDIGRLEAEIFRAARLVVDTGLHAKGWSREQAIAYMTGVTGMNESEVISEVERYMGQPGQACAYKVGELKILALRDRARAALGPRFVLKDFHAVVLENGGVPLTVLDRLVNEWIASQSKT